MVLEGVHALKHALRFGARVGRIVSPDPAELARLLADLAPDVAVPVEVEEVDEVAWDALARGGLPSPCLALADRPVQDPVAVLAHRGERPVVLLDEPRHLGNVGAAVRVAAAAGADGLVVLGGVDPWHPSAVRGGAGLQFALPVGRVDEVPATPRPIVAIDAGGAPLGSVELPPDAVLAFGSERRGLSDAVRQRAATTVAIPMRPGVSSLNLATAVAVLLYA